MNHKNEVLKQAKEVVSKLELDRIERIVIDVDDRYEQTIDIDISIELKR